MQRRCAVAQCVERLMDVAQGSCTLLEANEGCRLANADAGQAASCLYGALTPSTLFLSLFCKAERASANF